MLQHRQVIVSGALGTLDNESLLVSDSSFKEGCDDGMVSFQKVDAISGSMCKFVTKCNFLRRNLRIVLSSTHIVKYDYIFGHFSFSGKDSDAVIGSFKRTPPVGTHIGCACVSELSDGMFFYSYASVNEDNVGGGSISSSIQAVLIGEDRVSTPMILATDYKTSGFSEKPQGRIVSMQCHPSLQLLFVAYSQGQVQVWSYTACHLHLQQLLYKEGDGLGGLAVDETATDADGDADGDGSEGEGDEQASAAGTEVRAGRAQQGQGQGSGRSTGFGLGGRSSKKRQAQLLRAVASFALPTNTQLAKLDPEYAQLVRSPSSFRLDGRGRFAAVVWSERIVCVYDIHHLLALSVQVRQQIQQQAPATPAQLSVFGAFPCRAVPSAAGVEYAFGPLAFHPSAQLLMVAVLRHKAVPRSALSAGASPAIRVPLAPLLYAVSLRAHQPILSAVGCYDVGADCGDTGASVNWRPASLDCTPHTGLVVLGMQAVPYPSAGEAGHSSWVLDDAPAVDDVTSDSVSPGWRATVQGDDDADVAASASNAASAVTRPSTHRRALQRHFHLYSLSPAWQRKLGISMLLEPLHSALPVPPDAYVFGEAALSCRAVFVARQAEKSAQPGRSLLTAGASAKEQLSVRSFSLTDRAGLSSSAADAAQVEMSDVFPLLLTLRPAFDPVEDGASINSASTSYHLFRTHWVFPSYRSGESAAATHQGRLPALLTAPLLAENAGAAESWLQLPGPEHALSLTGWDEEMEAQFSEARVVHTFYPVQLLTAEGVGLPSLDSAAGTGGWDALVVGVVHRSVASRAVPAVGDPDAINAASASCLMPTVCFLRHQPGAAEPLRYAFTNLRSAAYWAHRPSPGTLTPVQGSAQATAEVLALSRDGTRILHLGCNAVSGDGGSGGKQAITVKSTWELGCGMSAIWASPAGAAAVVVCASADSGGSAGCQTVYATPPNPSAADFAALGSAAATRSGTGGARREFALTLRPGEVVVEVVWQPVPSSLAVGSRSCAGLTAEQADCLLALQCAWLWNGSESLVALRTTHRVLVCTPALQVLSEAEYCQGSPPPAPAPAVGLKGADSLIASFLQRLSTPAQQKSAAAARSARAGTLVDPVLGVTWLGATLAYICESGAVHYLLPGALPLPDESIMMRAVGARRTGRRRCSGKGLSAAGRLFTLPRNLSTSAPGSQRLLALLPDRALLTFLRRDEPYSGTCALPQVAFTQRPLNPVEPLVLGLLALSQRGLEKSSRASELVAALLTQYLALRTAESSGSSASSGACAASIITPRLAAALLCAKTVPAMQSTLTLGAGSGVNTLAGAVLASMVLGAQSGQGNSMTCGDLPVARWVPSGLKQQALRQAQLNKLAALDLLSARSELQELLLDSEAYGGAGLPQPRRPLSAQVTAAGLVEYVQSAVARGDLSAQQCALALRLLDLAGNYGSLAALVSRESVLSDEGKMTARAEALRVDRAGYLALRSAAKASPGEPGVIDVLLQGRLGVSALGGSLRRKNLTTAGAALPIQDVTAPTVSQLAALEQQQKSDQAHAGHQPCPALTALTAGAFATALAAAPGSLPVLGPRSMGLLAGDLVEDALGVNLQLEVCSTTAEDLFGGDSSGASGAGDKSGGAGEAGAGGVGGTYLGLPLPKTWVEGVGVGTKEHELLAGYWRFSDAAYAGEEGFHSVTVMPSGARMVFLDLSRFEGPHCELYCSAQDALKLEPSTSPVDPGEKHDNVKSLCDVVYCQDAAGPSSAWGLRCPAPRGSPLDLGLYHADAHRSKLTVELMACLEGILTSGVDRHVLLQRQVLDESGAEGAVLWSLCVTVDGSVLVSLGSGGDNGEVLRSGPGAVALGGEAGSWAHIALTVDASESPASVANETISQGPVAVTLWVKGEAVQGKLTPPPLPASSLNSTVLHVGRGLCRGWRLTELRVWADVRSAGDLDSCRDNHLAMAMKRKRLQLRVKGTKKLFTAYRELTVPAVASEVVVLPSLPGDKSTEEGADASADTAPPVSSGPPKKVLGTLGTSISLSKGGLAGPALSVPKAAPATVSSADSAAQPTAAAASPAPAAAASSTATAPASGTAPAAAAAAAAPMSARERRLSMLKAGGGAGAAQGAAGSTSAPAPAAAPTPVPAPAVVAVAASSDSASVSATSSTTSVDRSPQPAKAGHKVTFADPQPSPVVAASQGSASLPAPSTAPAVASAAAPPGMACIWTVGTLSELGLPPAATGTVEPYCSAKPFATPLWWAECRRPTGGAGADRAGLHCAPVSSAAANSPFAALPAGVLKAAESAICVALSRTQHRVAVLANKALQVYLVPTGSGGGEGSADSAQLAAQMQMGAVRLEHWAFLSPDMIMLVSSTSAFTIRVTPTAGAAADGVLPLKPVKIFDRIDLQDLSRWKERAVYDLQVCADGWTMLTTGPRPAVQPDEGATAGAGMLVSLYHAKSGRAVSFQAAGGCFRFGVPQALLVWRDTDRVSEDSLWSVSAFDLADLHSYWKGLAEQQAAAGGDAVAVHVPFSDQQSANKLWQEPLGLHSGALSPLLPPQWSLQLHSQDARTTGTQDAVVAACLDNASDPAQPCLRVASQRQGTVLGVNLKLFSQAVTSHTAPSVGTNSGAGKAASAGANANVVEPSPPVHIWSVGKLLYVLTRQGELHQCNVGAAVPQHVGSAALPLS